MGHPAGTHLEAPRGQAFGNGVLGGIKNRRDAAARHAVAAVVARQPAVAGFGRQRLADRNQQRRWQEGLQAVNQQAGEPLGDLRLFAWDTLSDYGIEDVREGLKQMLIVLDREPRLFVQQAEIREGLELLDQL